MQAAHPEESNLVSEWQRTKAGEELQCILSSRVFRGSQRCSRFLEYSVRQVLEGNGHKLHERSIGIEVFHRAADYDTSEDAIVRVTANEVRKRLAQYYQEVDSGPDPVISLPPGSYAAALRWQEAAPAPPSSASVSFAARFPTNKTGALILSAILLPAAVWVGFHTRAAKAESARALTRVADDDLVWSALFRPSQKTNIVIADAARFEIQELLTRDISLKEYLDPAYPINLSLTAPTDLQRVVRFMGSRQTTSIASTATGSRLLEVSRRHGVNAVIRHPRHLNVRDFKTDSFILLGSRLSIPWVELFEPSLNFPMKIDPKTWQFYLENRVPHMGEPSRFQNSPAGDQTWVDIAVLPNRERTGIILVFNAIDMVGIEASGEFLMNGSLASTLNGRTTKGIGAARNCVTEILLRVHSIGGSVSKEEIVAMRQEPSGRQEPDEVTSAHR